MPPPKLRTEDTRSEASTTRERQIAAAAHARKSKLAASAPHNGSALKELMLVHSESRNVVVPAQATHGTGVGNMISRQLRIPQLTAMLMKMVWTEAPNELLNTYRVAHNLPTPAAFTSPLNQALLTNPGLGRQSPTMARKKEKRRVPKDQLALAVRKHFNGAAVNEIDVVVELVYKVRNQNKAFRMRSTPGVGKK